MTDDEYKKSVQEGLKTGLKIPIDKKRLSNIYATLYIHIDALSDKQISKIQEGLSLLREGGLSFDESVGEGNYELSFDWSLSGGHLKQEKMTCFNCQVNLDGEDITFGRTKDNCLYPFCDNECVEEYKNSNKKEIIGIITNQV